MGNACGAKHTKYQPTDDEWRCPKCGADAESFWVDEIAEDSDPDCQLLHVNDLLTCGTEHGSTYSSYSIFGKSFAAMLQRKHNLGPCPHCKGSGLVKKSEEDGHA